MYAFVNSLPFLKRSAKIQRSGLAKMQLSDVSTKTKVSLYTVPVSNYGARCRYLAKRKELPEEVFQICSPKDFGGLKTDEYLKLNPLGKIPMLLIEGSDNNSTNVLFESAVISEYLAEKFPSYSPSFLPSTPENRAKARLIAQLLDVYVGPYHLYMYKRIEGDRVEGVNKMKPGFDAIEHMLDDNGPYALGKELSIADCCLWGNWAFYDFMLPTFFGWNPTDDRPKLRAWREKMGNESNAARQVYTDVFEALCGWWDNDRWQKLGMEAITAKPTIKL